jgi:hypothetical protein
MKTLIIIEVNHRKPIPALANMIAGRAYTIDGVTNAEPLSMKPMTVNELAGIGFSVDEIALGQGEVHRT